MWGLVPTGKAAQYTVLPSTAEPVNVNCTVTEDVVASETTDVAVETVGGGARGVNSAARMRYDVSASNVRLQP